MDHASGMKVLPLTPVEQTPRSILFVAVAKSVIRQAAGCHYQNKEITLAQLRSPVWTDLQVACIVFDLFGPGIDALALLRKLARARYRGRVVALTPQLPNPAMVRRELRKAAPSLRIGLLRNPG